MNTDINSLASQLDLEQSLAQLLVDNGFPTAYDIASVQADALASIEGLDIGIATELKSRARNWLAKHPPAVIEVNNSCDTENAESIMYVQNSRVESRPNTHARRGRPEKENKKVATSLRIDAETLSRLREKGKGWQTKATEGLKVLLDEGRI